MKFIAKVSFEPMQIDQMNEKCLEGTRSFGIQVVSTELRSGRTVSSIFFLNIVFGEILGKKRKRIFGLSLVTVYHNGSRSTYLIFLFGALTLINHNLYIIL